MDHFSFTAPYPSGVRSSYNAEYYKKQKVAQEVFNLEKEKREKVSYSCEKETTNKRVYKRHGSVDKPKRRQRPATASGPMARESKYKSEYPDWRFMKPHVERQPHHP